MEDKHLCPVCGKYEFTMLFEECPICDWSNDPYQRDHPSGLGENVISLTQAKFFYEKYGTIYPCENESEEQ